MGLHVRIGIEGVLLGGEETGVETAIRQTICALVEACPADDFVVFVSPRGRSSLPACPNVRYHVVQHCRLGKACRIWWQQVEAPRLARVLGLDLYHAPGYVLSPRMPVPSVVTAYDTIVFDRPELTTRTNALHYRWAVPRGLRRADAVVVPTAHIRDRIIARFGVAPSKVHVIPLGVAPCFAARPLNPDQRYLEQTGISPQARFGLIVGRKERKKNLPTILQAARASAACKNQAIELVFVGKDGGEGGAIHALAADLRLSERIKVLPYVDNATLVALYSNAAFVACASWEEGFGLPALEAMASGTPVLLSDIPAHRETSGNAAVLIPPADVQAWANELDRVLTSAAHRADLVRRGHETAARFRWRDHVRRLRDVYQWAVDAREPS